MSAGNDDSPHGILTRACRGATCATNWHADVGSPREDSVLEPAEIAQAIGEAASDKKAVDIALLDIRELSVIADFFVICTGANSRQIQAIAAAIEDKMTELRVERRGREGQADGGWLLLDYGDVIVHVFGPMERDFYRLERLWSSAPTVVSPQ